MDALAEETGPAPPPPAQKRQHMLECEDAAPCTIECITAVAPDGSGDNIVRLDADRYVCQRHTFVHTCTANTKRHPVEIGTTDGTVVCGFSGMEVACCCSAQDWSESRFSAHRRDDTCMGTRGAVFDASTRAIGTADGPSFRGSSGDPSREILYVDGTECRSVQKGKTRPRTIAPSTPTVRTGSLVRGLMDTLFNTQMREEIAADHRMKAIADFEDRDGQYVTAVWTRGCLPLRPYRDALAMLIAQKHRRTVPHVHATDHSRWCRGVVYMWSALADRHDVVADANFVLGCLYELAAGIRHHRSATVLWPGDDRLSDALPPTCDLDMFRFRFNPIRPRNCSEGVKMVRGQLSKRVVSADDCRRFATAIAEAMAPIQAIRASSAIASVALQLEDLDETSGLFNVC